MCLNRETEKFQPSVMDYALPVHYVQLLKKIASTLELLKLASELIIHIPIYGG